MPNWKTHVLFGIVFTALVYMLIKYYSLLRIDDMRFFLYLPVLFIYYQLPDIDSQSSVIKRIVTVLTSIIIVFLVIMFFINKEAIYLMGIIIVILMFLFTLVIKHRKIMHSIIAGLALSAPLLFFDTILAVLAFAAFFSHLLLDGEVSLL